MSERVDGAAGPPPRRGLPRRPGEQGRGPAAAVPPPAPHAPPASEVVGPAPADPVPAGRPVVLPAAGGVRRSGLPRPVTSGPAATATAAAADAVAPPPPAARPAPGVAGAAHASATPAPSAPPAPSRTPAPKTSPGRRRRGTRIAVGVPAAIVLAAVVVLSARWLSSLDAVAAFLDRYDGTAPLPAGAPVGIPVWLEWQHFLNAFFIVLIIRTGWQVRTQQRPPATWIRTNEGRFRTKHPPKRISLTLWTHLALDALWLLNGVLFVVLLFSTGQWLRIVPTSWQVVPEALAAALRYASFHWPTENGWANYNALQLLSYFAVTFVAAPLAAITGLRMSGAWPQRAKRLNRLYPVEWARAVHYPTMLFFVLFVIVHVVLVLATGALRNLNHMYGGSDASTWVGAGVFGGTALLTAAAVLAARPLVVAPVAQLMGRVGR